MNPEEPSRKRIPPKEFRLNIDLTHEPKPNLGLPPETIPGLSTIKALVRALRYQSVVQLTGLKVELMSINTADDELRVLLGQHGFQLGATISYSGEPAFLKYGLINCAFELIGAPLKAERQSVRFLKKMGFLADKKDVTDAWFFDAGIGFLEEMLEETKKDQLVFKVILNSQGSYRGAEDAPDEQWQDVDASQYFPCPFIVRDACLTNCDMIWLSKHFYL